ncbi:nuclear transport factor 2 family protein [Nocardia huaxiensis]|uniref:Nuclear transport factor 2 family protein n=1 Tax=Nocardia huaxiensis TaxID=2755382 RepID=A0A7D6V9E0_9NOCA|nr:nuclear transport factor 2 family protein [Nocardia huaxiensis]QLY29613.1 nuclear transport factor 2 family protein [Nocardia huaxiensis]
MSPTASTTIADRIAADWTALWNGDFALAPNLCTPDFRIRFASVSNDGTHPADTARGPEQFVAYLRDFRAARPGMRFALDGAATGSLNATGTGTFAARWCVDAPGGPSGIDMFAIVDGKIAEVWSVTGQRRFPTS